MSIRDILQQVKERLFDPSKLPTQDLLHVYEGKTLIQHLSSRNDFESLFNSILSFQLMQFKEKYGKSHGIFREYSDDVFHVNDLRDAFKPGGNGYKFHEWQYILNINIEAYIITLAKNLPADQIRSRITDPLTFYPFLKSTVDGYFVRLQENLKIKNKISSIFTNIACKTAIKNVLHDAHSIQDLKNVINELIELKTHSIFSCYVDTVSQVRGRFVSSFQRIPMSLVDGRTEGQRLIDSLTTLINSLSVTEVRANQIFNLIDLYHLANDSLKKELSVLLPNLLKNYDNYHCVLKKIYDLGEGALLSSLSSADCENILHIINADYGSKYSTDVSVDLDPIELVHPEDFHLAYLFGYGDFPRLASVSVIAYGLNASILYDCPKISICKVTNCSNEMFITMLNFSQYHAALISYDDSAISDYVFFINEIAAMMKNGVIPRNKITIRPTHISQLNSFINPDFTKTSFPSITETIYIDVIPKRGEPTRLKIDASGIEVVGMPKLTKSAAATRAVVRLSAPSSSSSSSTNPAESQGKLYPTP